MKVISSSIINVVIVIYSVRCVKFKLVSCKRFFLYHHSLATLHSRKHLVSRFSLPTTAAWCNQRPHRPYHKLPPILPAGTSYVWGAEAVREGRVKCRRSDRWGWFLSNFVHLEFQPFSTSLCGTSNRVVGLSLLRAYRGSISSETQAAAM